MVIGRFIISLRLAFTQKIMLFCNIFSNIFHHIVDRCPLIRPVVVVVVVIRQCRGQVDRKSVERIRERT